MTAPELLTPGPRYQADHEYTVEAALFDVDNTLVSNAAPDLPSERFRDAAETARQSGLSVALASARPVSKTAHIIDYIGADGLSILCNGAQIIDSADKSVVAEWFIDPVTCQAMIAELGRLGVVYWINDDGVDYFPAPDGSFERQTDIWRADSPRITVPGYHPGKPFVINLHDVTAEQTEAVSTFVKHYGDADVTTLIAHEVAQPDGSKLYDQFIVHRHANKLHALQEVARLQGIPLDRFAAVGDGRNDSVIVGAAGAGVAMGNSARETLDVATFIAPDREADGAAVALEQLTRRHH